jgi:hypothetical protein
MKKSLLFLAPFPDIRYPNDGMISRISAIDNFFIDDERTYLYISLFKNIKKYHRSDRKLEIYELNIIVHFLLILKILISARIIYSHSIYQLKNIWYLLFFLKQKIVLDAHGVVPEEIVFFQRKTLLYYILVLLEKIIFSRKNVDIVCVTDAMINHFKRKYPKFKGSFLKFCILPKQLYLEQEAENHNRRFLTEIENLEEKTVVLYSGGTAGWQNVKLMLEIIESNQTGNIQFVILSVEIQEFKQLIEKTKIKSDYITLKSVAPDELSAYYKIADYGFILRDDNVVNHVANPTKLVEYLYYGIIPIVLTPNIGDYPSLNYEYITVDNFNININKPCQRSVVNENIVKKIITTNSNIDFRNFVLSA